MRQDTDRMAAARSARRPAWGFVILSCNASSRMQAFLITRTIDARVFNINNY